MTCRALLLCGTAAVVCLFVNGCTRETAPAEAEDVAENAAPSGDQAQIEQLALVNRMLASREMAVLGAYGHASVRSSSNPDRYFISKAVSPALVTASDIYESDLESKPVSADALGLLEDRFLHGEIYKARPDVMAIVYTSAPSVVAFSVSSVPLPTNPLSPQQPARAGLRPSPRPGRRARGDQHAGAWRRSGRCARQEHDDAPVGERRRGRERIDRQRGQRRS